MNKQHNNWNLTRKVSAGDPVQIAMLKGLVAGSVTTALGLVFRRSGLFRVGTLKKT